MTTADTSIDLDDLCPITEGAKLLHSAVSTLRGHLTAGRLTRFYVGRRVLVSRTELARFVKVGAKDASNEPIAA